MNHCRDCKHFDLKSPLYDRRDWCICQRISEVANDGLAQLDGEGMYEGVSLYVSPDFGCVQFEER